MRDPYLEIGSQMNSLSKSQKKVAQYILDNPNNILFQTVEKLAKEVGVSDATVVRFANALGYKGYPDLQNHIQRRLQRKLKTTERLKSDQTLGNTFEEQIKEYIMQDVHNVQSIIEDIDTDQFEKVIQAILKAKNIYIISSRSAGSPGMFLHYYLDMLLGNVTHVKVLETDGEKMFNIDKNDVAFAISYARYTRSTIELFRYAKERNACTIALTDHFSSPLVHHADFALYTKSDSSSFFDSFAASMSMINLILAFVGKYKEEGNNDRLEELEAVWEKLNIFY
ncbi:MurR/RpiR family transcriptional regulator [Chungangia koreensis]|uniref:MurR/RpiR family transcriptional regulator n=1 Tax=Chungangia koreensis TaxID=752657 RepID=A0ABV8X4I7_9LACT